MKRNYGKILVIVVLMVLIATHIALADNSAGSDSAYIATAFRDGLMSAFGWIIGALLDLVGFIASLLFSIGGWLINFAIDLNIQVLTSPIVQVGWLISRDVTNLGLVVAVIVMAFATMLNSKSYGLKQVLFRVVAVTLLINFSLTIAGVFLDASNVLTTYFVTKASPEKDAKLDFGTALARAFNPQSLLQITKKQDEGIKGALLKFDDNLLSFLGGLFFTVLFTILGAITFLGIAVMLLARYVILGILLTVMPLAWLAWVLPGLEKYQKEWWDNFLKQVLFAPAVTFFLYLAVYSVISLGDYYKTIAEHAGASGKILEAELPGGVAQLGNMIIALGLMMGGLMAADRLGVQGSKTFLGAANAVRGWAEGKVKGTAKGMVTEPLGTAVGQGLAKRMQNIGANSGKTIGFLTRPLRSIGATMQQAGTGRGQQLAAEGQKRTKDYTKDQRNALYKNASKDDQMGMMTNAIAKGDNEFLADKITPETKAMFERYGSGKEFEKMEKLTGKSLAMVTGKDKNGKDITKEEAAEQFYSSKNFSSADWAKIDPKMFTDPQLGGLARKNFLINQPGTLGRVMMKSKDPKSLARNFQETEKEMVNSHIKKVAERLDPSGAIIDPAELNRIKNASIEEQLKWLQREDPKSEEIENLKNLHKSVSQNLAARFFTSDIEAPATPPSPAPSTPPPPSA